MNIFLSYSFKDKEIADHVSLQIKESNVGSINEYELNVSEIHILDELRYNIRKSDYVIFFISNNFLNSNYSMLELSEALNELRIRKINIIPILIEKCSIPSELLEIGIIDFSKSFEKGMEKLLTKLTIKKKIDLEEISPWVYEKIVAIFLKEYGFKIIQGENNRDIGVDYICEYNAKDPFGQKVKEVWMVEVKFYKNERLSINEIKKLYYYVQDSSLKGANLLMITNNILNSAAMEYLNDLKENAVTQVTVLDGPAFERLIYKKTRLVNRIAEVLYDSNQ
ncbi:hypothetical protein BK131_00650 [Paenibacillus amylolyticus]|uniref:TIR domain-containing protein n=1 Tax=Paenibacillus amylolyticus TaxID=1451 RepID=A0A1R1C398_PAEAM|nr:TIR domain-containing protein [Paenibacillus amylolyticus]OMF16544.1 hypothetical protein BK131_00650 [Paenibacillus amylolyticus]